MDTQQQGGEPGRIKRGYRGPLSPSPRLDGAKHAAVKREGREKRRSGAADGVPDRGQQMPAVTPSSAPTPLWPPGEQSGRRALQSVLGAAEPKAQKARPRSGLPRAPRAAGPPRESAPHTSARAELGTHEPEAGACGAAGEEDGVPVNNAPGIGRRCAHVRADQ